MKTIHVFKAQPTAGIAEECTTLVIEDVLPDLDKGLPIDRFMRAAHERFDAQAAQVFEALSVLPQGTLHSLLVLLLRRNAAYLSLGHTADGIASDDAAKEGA